MNSLVSILIPLYNSEKYIAETLNSCINQTYKNIEIIIVDDGSSDEGLAIAREYEKNYNNIWVYTQENSGAQKARNLAFEKSKGDYIQYLDADDVLSEDKIENQMKLVSEYGDNNVYTCKFMRFSDTTLNAYYKKNKIDQSFDNAVDWLISSWSNGGMGQTSIWLTPRILIEKAGKWNENLEKNQDGEFFSRVILNAEKVIYSNKSLVYYRVTGSGSISFQMTEKAAKATLLSYKLYEENCIIINDYKIKKAIAYCYISFINHHYPKYPLLINEAKLSIINLGFAPLDLVEGNFRKIAKIIGFDSSLKVRYFFKRIKEKVN
jgi:glycosyltransferase involved in cell wall biosynthesis